MADVELALRWLRRARLAGALPLAAGLVVFAGWLATRSEGWVVAGVGLLWVGVALVLGGAIALWRYRRLARSASLAAHDVRRATGVTLALLLANFPLAFGLSTAAVAIETAWVVIVHNAEPRTLSGLRIVGGGVDEALDPLAPDERARRTFWIERDGCLELVVPGSPDRRAVLSDYVTGLQGGRAEVTVGPGDGIAVESRP